MTRIRFTVLLAISLGSMMFAIRAVGDTERRLTLDDVVRLVLEQNPDIAEAEARLQEADARLQAARSAMIPSLKVRGGYSVWTEDQRLLPATRHGEPGVFGDGMFSAEIVMSMPLYTGGRVSAERKVAAWNRTAAEGRGERTRELLVFQAVSITHRLQAQDAVIQSLEVAVHAMDEQCNRIEALVEEGKSARVDWLRTKVRRAELHERLVRETNLRTIWLRAWAAILGLSDTAVPAPTGVSDRLSPTVCQDAERCMQQALQKRHDYFAVKADVSAAEAAVRAVRSGRRPVVAAQAAYGMRWMPDPAEAPDGADDRETIGRVGVTMEWPLFDGRLTAARVDEQTARWRAARERLRKLELQIRFEIETTLSGIASAAERVQTSEEAVEQAREGFRIVKEMFDLGKSTLTDVLDSQAALTAAETAQVRALADLAISEAEHKLAMGVMIP